MEDKRTEVSIFDKSNPLSVINSVSPQIAERLHQVPKAFLLYEEADFRYKYTVTQVDNALRVSFWREYYRRCASIERKSSEAKILSVDIFGGICNENYFYSRWLKIDWRVAWMVLPMPKYEDNLEYILGSSVERYKEIFAIPFYEEVENKRTGKINRRYNATNVRIFLAAHKQLEDRVKGSVIQRQDVRQLNVNKKAEDVSNELTLAQIEEKIRLLESEDGRGKGSSQRKADADSDMEDQDGIFDGEVVEDGEDTGGGECGGSEVSEDVSGEDSDDQLDSTDDEEDGDI